MIDIAATAEFILEAFQTLGARPLANGALDAQKIPDRGDSYVAVSEQKELFILLQVGQETFVEERRLKVLRVLTGDDFTIVNAATNEVVRSRFAVVALRSGNEDLAPSFAMVASTLLSTLADEPTPADVIEFLDSLIVLVAPQRPAATSTVIGLWGELWAIASVDNPELFAAAWHSEPGDRFDFALPNARVEVKTTSGPDLNHEFGLDQLSIGDAKPTWVASLTVVSDPNGRSIIDLLDELLGVLPGPLAAKINRIVLRTISGDIESLRDFTFVPVGAEPFLAFAAEDVPRPVVEPGSGVTAVRFRAALNQVIPVARSLPELLRLLK